MTEIKSLRIFPGSDVTVAEVHRLSSQSQRALVDQSVRGKVSTERTLSVEPGSPATQKPSNPSPEVTRG